MTEGNKSRPNPCRKSNKGSAKTKNEAEIENMQPGHKLNIERKQPNPA